MNHIKIWEVKPSKEAIEIAARCWCDPQTESKIMDAELAEAFAKRIEHLIEIIDVMGYALTDIAHSVKTIDDSKDVADKALADVLEFRSRGM